MAGEKKGGFFTELANRIRKAVAPTAEEKVVEATQALIAMIQDPRNEMARISYKAYQEKLEELQHKSQSLTANSPQQQLENNKRLIDKLNRGKEGTLERIQKIKEGETDDLEGSQTSLNKNQFLGSDDPEQQKQEAKELFDGQIKDANDAISELEKNFEAKQKEFKKKQKTLEKESGKLLKDTVLILRTPNTNSSTKKMDDKQDKKLADLLETMHKAGKNLNERHLNVLSVEQKVNTELLSLTEKMNKEKQFDQRSNEEKMMDGITVDSTPQSKYEKGIENALKELEDIKTSKSSVAEKFQQLSAKIKALERENETLRNNPDLENIMKQMEVLQVLNEYKQTINADPKMQKIQQAVDKREEKKNEISGPTNGKKTRTNIAERFDNLSEKRKGEMQASLNIPGKSVKGLLGELTMHEIAANPQTPPMVQDAKEINPGTQKQQQMQQPVEKGTNKQGNTRRAEEMENNQPEQKDLDSRSVSVDSGLCQSQPSSPTSSRRKSVKDLINQFNSISGTGDTGTEAPQVPIANGQLDVGKDKRPGIAV